MNETLRELKEVLAIVGPHPVVDEGWKVNAVRDSIFVAIKRVCDQLSQP